MHDAHAGRHGAEVGQRLLAPLQELVALLVAFELELEVLAFGLLARKRVDLHRVVDDEIARHERIDLLRIAAKALHRCAHRREVDDAWHAGEVLQHDAAWQERDLDLARGVGAKVRDVAHVLLGHDIVVEVAQRLLEQHADREWQRAHAAEAAALENGEREVRERALSDLEGGLCAERIGDHVGQRFYLAKAALGRSPIGSSLLAILPMAWAMCAPRLAALLLGLLAVSACKSTPVPDLAKNSELYAFSEFVTKLPGDRKVFVATLEDARETVTPAAPAGDVKFPILYDTDERWLRPVSEMVDEILRREIEDSEIFDEVCESPKDAQIVITPSLVAFRTGALEEISGGRGIAEVAIRFRVHGPADASGERTLALDQTVVDRKVTEASFRTASRYVLAGVSLRACVVRMLQVLDSKNIGRDGMPLPVPAAAEASFRR